MSHDNTFDPYLPMCFRHFCGKYVDELSSGWICDWFCFCILLHDTITSRLCSQDFFNQLKDSMCSKVFWKTLVNSETNMMHHMQIKHLIHPHPQTHSFCFIVDAARPFRLTALDSNRFLSWVNGEVEDHYVIRCSRTWRWCELTVTWALENIKTIIKWFITST